jgi:hypothetical protein
MYIDGRIILKFNLEKMGYEVGDFNQLSHDRVHDEQPEESREFLCQLRYCLLLKKDPETCGVVYLVGRDA